MIRVLVQARVASSRLPGKILLPLAGRPLLAWVLTRLAAAELPACEVMVATTLELADDTTAQLAAECGARSFRGPSEDVLGRYVAAAADLTDDDVVVRATADNPLYCPRRTAAIVAEHVGRNAEYTYVDGLSYVVPEVMCVGALRAMERIAKSSYYREHVTPFFRDESTKFLVHTLPRDWEGLQPHLRLTVDTPAEYDRMFRVCAELGAENPLFTVEAAYEWCRGHPE